MSENSKKQVIQVVIIVVVLTAAGLLAFRPRPQRQAPGSYAYDLTSGKLVVQRQGEPAPAGSNLVLAAVYSCSSCADPSARYVGYLTRESEEYRKVLQSGEPPTPQQMAASSEVRTVDGEQWLSSASDAAIALMTSAKQKCPAGATASLCTP